MIVYVEQLAVDVIFINQIVTIRLVHVYCAFTWLNVL